MEWNRSRVLALGGFAAGVAAALVAVYSALGPPTPHIAVAKAAAATSTSSTVRFGHVRVSQRLQPMGVACFTVAQGSSTVARSCLSHLNSTEIGYAASRRAIGGLAGTDVKAVIVRLTHGGTVWAQLRGGAFYAALPTGHRARAVVKVLRDGSRRTFRVKQAR
jgi:hypothetical protein